MQVVRRTWDWLAEQPEDAAELALLLFQAAPKLNFSEMGPSRQASSKIPRRASYKEQGGFVQRLTRAVPMPCGAPNQTAFIQAFIKRSRVRSRAASGSASLAPCPCLLVILTLNPKPK